jgi:hypothetical protein
VLSEAEHGYTAGSVEVSMDYFLYYTFRTKKSPFFDKQVDFPHIFVYLILALRI